MGLGKLQVRVKSGKLIELLEPSDSGSRFCVDGKEVVAIVSSHPINFTKECKPDEREIWPREIIQQAIAQCAQEIDVERANGCILWGISKLEIKDAILHDNDYKINQTHYSVHLQFCKYVALQ